MRDMLKALVAGTTALRLLVAELRDLNPEGFDFTSVAINSWGELKVAVGSDEEAAPFLAVMDGEWGPEANHDSDGWYQRSTPGQWAGVNVVLNVCYRLPEPEADAEGGEPRG